MCEIPVFSLIWEHSHNFFPKSNAVDVQHGSHDTATAVVELSQQLSWIDTDVVVAR